MRHRVKKKQLGRGRAHRRSMLKNLVSSLILHERVHTTETKAKVLRSIMEHLITMTKKKDSMNAIRYLKKHLFVEAASRKMLTTLKTRYTEKSSGFTRITALKFRKGDNAKIVQIELIS